MIQYARGLAAGLVLPIFCASAQSPSGPASNFERECQALASQESLSAAARLHALFDLHWKHALRESPEMATQLGHYEYNTLWTHESLDAVDRRKREASAPLRVLDRIPRAELGPADQLNYDLFRRNTEAEIEGNRFPEELLAITQLSGVHQSIPQLIEVMPRATREHYEQILARLESVPRLIDQTIVLLDKGLSQGVTPPRVTLRDVPQQVKSQVPREPMQSALLRPFAEFPESIPAPDRPQLRARAEAVYHEKVVPAYLRLHRFLESKYIPGCRESIAATALPDGAEWYAYNVRQRTTTQLSPAEIHQIGLNEVARIRSEMDQTIKASGFKGDFKAFCQFLRTDRRFFYTRAEDLLEGYRDIGKRADAGLVRLFKKLPRLPYGVIAIPAYSEKSQTTAYYQPGSLEAARPGYFYANTYDLRSRPKWEMEALTMHEAVPGHHLQIALAQELDGVPDFRRHGGYTAFVEGWGLYSESLGSEIGFYKDPYSRFGQLTYEMWRAVRLVVDTGMHSMGWSREKAIEFFKANSSKPEHDIVVEIDRYIVWPGQALAYKIGELKIKELRKKAEAALGPQFDLRAFHDVVLEQGALPLQVLEQRVDRWISDSKRRP